MTPATVVLTRPGRHRPLGSLVGDVDAFLESTYGQSPWCRPAGAAGLPPFTLGDVDDLLASALLRQPFFRVVRDGDTISPGTYTRTIHLSGGTVTGVAEPARVRDLLRDGSTLVLESAHRYVPALARWCADLALDLELPTQANVYVTAPGGSGFAAHVDSHDVFILQTQGTKRWTIRERSTRLPSPVSDDRAELTAAATVDTPRRERWDMVAGAVAYLPRGFPHRASAGDGEFSIHVTVGVLAAAKEDVARAAAARAAARRWPRETVAARPLSSSPGLAEVVVDDDDIRAVLARRLVASIATPTAPGLAAPVEMTEDAVLVLAVDAVVLDRSPPGVLTVVLPDRELEFATPHAADAAASLLTASADSSEGAPVRALTTIERELAGALVEGGVLTAVRRVNG